MRTVAVRITADVQGGIANIKTFKGAISDFGSEMDRLGVKHKSQLNSLTNTVGAVGIGLTGAFGLIERSALGFDKQMSAVASVATATGAQLGQLRMAALAAGRDTAYTATQAGQAEEELAKAGISTADILGGALTGALNLAAAGQMDLSDAATIAAQTMNIFGLSGKDVGHIADVLASAANKSAADMTGLGDSLKQGGLIAAEMGLSFEDTTAILAAFADKGLAASDAGTSLKTMLQKLQSPSQQAADAMRDIGLKVYDANGAFVGAANLAQNLHDALGPLTQAQRDYALSTIFGTDATRAATVVADLGASGLAKYRDALNEVGSAQDTAAAKLNNLSGDLQKLRGSVETLTISSSAGGLRELVQGTDRFVKSLSTIPSGVSSTAVGLTGLIGVTALGAAAFARARAKVDEFQTTLEKMGPQGAKVSGALGSVTGALGRLTVALAVAQVASAAFGSDASGTLSFTVKALTQFGRSSHVMLDQLDSDLEALKTRGAAGFGNALGSTIEGLTGTGSLFDDSITHARQRLASYDDALAAMVSAGHADDAKKAFDKIAAAATKQGVSMSELNAAFPQYVSLTDGSTASQQASVAATASQKRQFDLLHGSLEGAIDATGGLKQAFDALNGKSIDAAMGAIHVTQAVDQLTQSMKENGHTFDVNTPKGAANTDAFIRGAQAARDHAEAVRVMTGSVDQANATFQQDIDKLDKAAAAGGATAGQIRDLNNAYGQLPPLVSSQVSAPGASLAASQVGRVNSELDRLDGRRIVFDVWEQDHTGSGARNSPGSFHNTHGQRWGGVTVHAASGALRDAALYSPLGPARYAFAEPATRGEAFIPRSGNMARSRAIADYVVGNWLGGSTSWGGSSSGGGGTATVIHEHRIVVEGTGLMRNLRAEIRSQGGSVQKVLGKS